MRLLFALAMFSASLAIAEEKSVEIPLKSIWALSMPETRDVRELDSKLDRHKLSNQQLIQKSLVEGIRYALRDRAPEGHSAGLGFVVVGTGEEALKNAHAVITDKKSKKDPERWLPPDVALSLVFYSHLCGRNIWITDIEREGNSFLVKYQAVPHSTQISTTHFALIPIGKLPESTYQVRYRQAPAMDSKGQSSTLSEDMRQRVVSESFSFGVRK